MDHQSLVNEAVEKKRLSSSARENIARWLVGAHYEAYRDELKLMIEAGKWDELDDAFFQVLPFGTGGRRGMVGIGSNRMNTAAIAESAQGLANKLRKNVTERNPRVVIAYDTRLTSPSFTEKTASVLAANDVEVYLFDGPRSTPQLSFSIRDLDCDAGIVISASHNPPEDNGFKAYWSDGGQVVPPLDSELIDEVKNVSEVDEIPFEEGYGKGLIRRLGPEDDIRYFEAVLAESVSDVRDLKIVYSPLHGAGISSVYPVLMAAGFDDLHLVECQKDPDGRFPNVPDHKPNPEITTGFDAAISLGKAIKADCIMVSDPDADRMSVAVPARDGDDFVILSGNQSSALMMEFIASRMKADGTLRPEHRVYSTCVSSPLMPTIARAYGLEVNDQLLVGFKWIAEQIKLQERPEDFLFASEESIGYMKGPRMRDKDAAIAALIFAELAAAKKADGRSILDYLDEIYKKYGYFRDAGASIFLEGISGRDRITKIMNTLRENPPKEIGGHPIVAVVDREALVVNDPDGNKIGTIEGPPSNLLVFRLREDNKSWIAVRPSGTEPKIKFYFSLFKEVDADLESIKTAQKDEINSLMKAMTDMAMGIE